jgi:hypothetical protein
MCLIIYQPKGRSVPIELLHSAAQYNPDGFGFMGFDRARAVHVERLPEVTLRQLETLADRFGGEECAYHFRHRTRGSSRPENLHPFKLAQSLYLMHNGTASVPLRLPGRSDTWHLVHDYLEPLLSHRRRLIYDNAFRRILNQWLGPKNRLVILDAEEQRIELLNRADGVEWKGLWLSNSRWLNREELGVPDDGKGSDILNGTEVAFC